MGLDKQKQYLLGLGLFLFLVVVSLSALNEHRLDVYVSLFSVCYFAMNALYRPRKRVFDFVGLSLFLVFVSIVTQKVLVILA
jgi:hypothetical protein